MATRSTQMADAIPGTGLAPGKASVPNSSFGNANYPRLPTSTDRLIGQRIRERRIGAKLSMAALAEGLGISLRQMYKYETGKNRISASRLYEIDTLIGPRDMNYFFQAGA